MSAGQCCFWVVIWQWHWHWPIMVFPIIHLADFFSELTMWQWQCFCSCGFTIQKPHIVHGSLQQMWNYWPIPLVTYMPIQYCAVFWSRQSTPPINLLYCETANGWSISVLLFVALDHRLAFSTELTPFRWRTVTQVCCPSILLRLHD